MRKLILKYKHRIRSMGRMHTLHALSHAKDSTVSTYDLSHLIPNTPDQSSTSSPPLSSWLINTLTRIYSVLLVSRTYSLLGNWYYRIYRPEREIFWALLDEGGSLCFSKHMLPSMMKTSRTLGNPRLFCRGEKALSETTGKLQESFPQILKTLFIKRQLQKRQKTLLRVLWSGKAQRQNVKTMIDFPFNSHISKFLLMSHFLSHTTLKSTSLTTT